MKILLLNPAEVRRHLQYFNFFKRHNRIRIWCPDLQHSTTTNSENNPWRAIGSDVQYGVRDPEALFLSALTEFNKALALAKHSFNTSTVALILFTQADDWKPVLASSS